MQKLFHELVVDRGQPVVRTLGVGEDREVGDAPPASAFLEQINRLGALVEKLGPVTVSASVWPLRLVADPTAANKLVPRPVHRHVQIMVLELGPPFELLHRALDDPGKEREILAPAHLHLAVAATAATVVVHVLGDVRSLAVPLARLESHTTRHTLSRPQVAPGVMRPRPLSFTAQSVFMMSGAHSSAHIA